MNDSENLRELKSQLESLGYNDKPNCYECKFRRELGYSSHSKCVVLTDKLEGERKKQVEDLIDLLGSDLLKSGQIKFNQHGVDNGWASWPSNFDPSWLEKCEFFERSI